MALSWFCMTPTPFKTTGEIDEEAFAQFLQRYIDSNIGIYLGSGGTSEAHALTGAELQRLYEIGVEVCKGKIAVHANLPDEHSARRTLEHAQRAIKAGVEVVHLYPLEARHSMKPNEAELNAYFDNLLTVIKTPVTFAVNNRLMRYDTTPRQVAEIVARYPQIVGIRMSDVRESYVIELRDRIKRELTYHVMLPGAMNTLQVGATGLFGSEGGIIPKTCRLFMDSYDKGDYAEAAKIYAQIDRFNRFCSRWAPPAPRWYKMAMKVLKLPGGEGGIREPYLMPPPGDVAIFTEGLLKLGIAEINEQARIAGLA
jgi:dihydrodipicolinate synthase/N-acetylneuraminate lyase